MQTLGGHPFQRVLYHCGYLTPYEAHYIFKQTFTIIYVFAAQYCVIACMLNFDQFVT